MQVRSPGHTHISDLPQSQRAIQAKCRHPTGTFVEFPAAAVEQSIPQRFEKIVRSFPDRIAVRCPGRGLAYAELDDRVNRIARGLLKRHETADRPIALLLEANDLAIAGVLAVLKAGKIYVPLDPSYPRARLLSILGHSGAGIILTDQNNLVLAKELASGDRRCITIEEAAAEGRAENPVVVASPDAPAAIFYTSGSTGKPKGVVQSHRSVLHRVLIDTNQFHICGDDRLSLLSSPSYSVSLRNLFGGLLNGAAVCPFNLATDGLRSVESWLIRQRVTIVFSVPTISRQFIGSLSDHTRFPFVRLIYLGGESVTKEDVDLCRRFFPEAILVNSLASNEAGIICDYFMDKDSQISGARVPAGYAVGGKRIVVVKEDGEEAGFGEIGEISVGSRYLSLGYWRDQDLTNIVFVPDPEDAMARLYRTGDIGFLTDDHCLMHLGRKGLRAKIGGARVELDEVEAVLRKHPGVSEAVVDTRKGQSDEDQLIAFVVPLRGRGLTSNELRNDLMAEIPLYMIPSDFVFLEALPLTPNGKIDRQALVKPIHEGSGIRAPYVPPNTDEEARLVRIWSAVLSVDRVGIRDDFFALGGNSLLAAGLVEEISKSLGTALPVSAVYQAPTVEQMARILGGDPQTTASKSLLWLQPRGSRNSFFWIHGQASDAVLPQYLGPDQPVYGVIHQSMDGKPASYTTVESIADHYLAEMRTVQPQGPYLLGGYCFGGLVAFEIAQRLTKRGEEISLLFLLDPPPPPNLEIEPGNVPSTEPRAHAASLLKKVARPILLPVLTIGRRIAINAILSFGYPIPVAQRSAYILDVYSRAMSRYRPISYPGRIVIFKAADDRRDIRGWSRLAEKGVEIQVVPGNHSNVLREPCLKFWAEKLQTRIDAVSGRKSEIS